MNLLVIKNVIYNEVNSQKSNVFRDYNLIFYSYDIENEKEIIR